MRQISFNKPTYKTWMFLSLLVIQIVFQIVGIFLYDVTPSWVWTICDSSLLMIPLILGLWAGIICCIPNIISELVWYFKDVSKYKGALMHAISLFAVVLLLGLLKLLLERKKIKYFIIFIIIGFEAGLLLERLLYIGLRILVGASKPTYLNWKNVSTNFMSWGNLIMLIIIIGLYLCEKFLIKKDIDKSVVN